MSVPTFLRGLLRSSRRDRRLRIQALLPVLVDAGGQHAGLEAEAGGSGATSWSAGSARNDREAPIAGLAMIGRERRMQIYRAFNTALPVADRYGLSGREEEIRSLAAGVLDNRKHGIIYGPRGAGKTSVARVFGDFADEAGCEVIYSSVSGDYDFVSLFRPFLPFLDTSGTAVKLAARLASEDFGVRLLADLLIGARKQTVLILDEFDRIGSSAAKDQVASLLKLLSDAHCNVQVILIGIAGNVDDLVAGHASLRRHLVALPIGSLSVDTVRGIIAGCLEQAGFIAEDDALKMLADMALGSAYHARVFGLHAALAADARDASELLPVDAESGFDQAIAEWSIVSSTPHAVVRRILAVERDAEVLVSCVAIIAASHTTVSVAEVQALCEQTMPRPDGWHAQASELFRWLSPILQPTNAQHEFVFSDSLAPQFIMLMVLRFSDATVRARQEENVLAFPAGLRTRLQGLQTS